MFDEIKNTLKFFFKYLFLSFTLIVYFEPVRAESELDTFSLKLSIYQNSKNNRFLKNFYLQRDYSPVFVTKINEGRASALLKALESSDYHGIPSALYKLNEIRNDIKKLRSETELGALEVKLAKNFMLYVKHMKSGVLDPEVINEKLIANAVLMDDVKVPKQLDLKLKKIDFAGVFLTFLETKPVTFFNEIQPQSSDYGWLVREKKNLEKALELGGWGKKITAPILLPGDKGEEVVKLRNRLIRMGLMEKSYSPIYDKKLKSSVKKFQMLHGLIEDGVAGEITLHEINKSIKDRLKLVVASLERRRWLSGDYGDKYLIVNIPEFRLRIIEKGKTIYQSKVVVGQDRPNTRTPEFSNKLQFMVINPSWYVPRSIILEEYLPNIRKNINAASELFFTDKSGNYVAREDINFDVLIDEDFPYGMKQPPSKDNALGAVKFMLPNIHNIYLHDTPDKNLFSEEVRAFSHGCVRVYQPFELAYELLSANFNNPKVVFDNLLKNEVEFKLNLREQIPVHITYSTVWSNSGKEVSYRRDIYGRDVEIYESLQELGLSL
ncbi:MAG: L,D-transpeptidase family protein [Paracoccaceae bacterium]